MRLAHFATVAALMAASPARAQPPAAVDVGACLAELHEPPADPEADTESRDCARIGGRAVAVHATIATSDDGADIDLELVTAAGRTSLRVGRARRAHGFERITLVDLVRVRVAAADGAPDVAIVTVTGYVTGEDDSWHDDTAVVVPISARPPRAIWVGPGDYERGRLGVCTTTRTARIRAHAGVVRVRSDVSASVDAEGLAALGPELAETLRHECRAPRRVRADVPLR